jgi:predicted nucleic acid-binding protein
MSYKIYIDANVLLDYCLHRENKTESKIILDKINDGTYRGYISGSTIHILSYVLSKMFGAKKTKSLILQLLTEFNVIDMSKDMMVQAMHSKIDDIEDALQYYVAINNKMNYFITQDKKFIKEGLPILPIYTPALFIKEIIEQK